MPTTDLRVMSFNLRQQNPDPASSDAHPWHARRPLAAEAIGAFDPDLLGTQEGYPFQIDDLAADLPGYSTFGRPRSDRPVLSDETVAVFYRASRFDRTGGGHYWLSPTPDVPGSAGFGNAFRRMVTWVRLRDRASDGRELVLLNTHWDHESAEARLQSAELMRDRLPEVAPGLPAIVTGDFNCDETRPPHAVLTGDGSARPLLDSFRRRFPIRGGDEATFHDFAGRTAGPRIDWILHDAAFATTDAGIDRTRSDGPQPWPSDHFPVTAVLRRTDPE